MREAIEALIKDWKSTTAPKRPGDLEHPHNQAIFAVEWAGYNKLLRCVDALERVLKEDKPKVEIELVTDDNREQLQARVFDWVKRTFGPMNAHPHERCRRFLEEALELAQAEALSKGEVLALVEHVFAKPYGTPRQEAGGVGVTLLAYCQAKGFSAGEAESEEFDRVLGISPEEFRARHDRKAEAGVALRSEKPPVEKSETPEELQKRIEDNAQFLDPSMWR